MFTRLMGLKTISPTALHELIQRGGRFCYRRESGPNLDQGARSRRKAPGCRRLYVERSAVRQGFVSSILLFQFHVQKSTQCRPASERLRIHQRSRNVSGHQWLAQRGVADAIGNVVSAGRQLVFCRQRLKLPTPSRSFWKQR